VGSYLTVGLTGFLVLIFVFTDAFVVAAALYDLRSRRKVHPELLRWGWAVVIIQQFVLALGTTSTFLALSNLFR
jgi:hypothetical protein